MNDLQKWREAKRYTRRDIADALGFSIRTIQSWEKSERLPQIVDLEPYAKLLGVPVAKLVKTLSDDVKSKK